MGAEIRTIVSFKSAAFNMTEPKSYFINPCCFGDDLAKWLIRELRNRGVDADGEPGQEDFGWYFNFQVADMLHVFVIGHRPGDQSEEGTWIGWVERRSRFWVSARGVHAAAPQTLHSILSSSPQIREVRWHFRHDFDKGHEELGATAP